MIDLAQRSEPYEIVLPYGLSVTVKPLTTAGMAAAQAAARRAVEAIERQARERTEAGLARDGLPVLSTEGERDGFYQAQLIRELALRHITTWTGVELEGGPAPPTPANIAAVVELYPVGERFFQEFTLRQVLLNAAKTDQGPLPLALPVGRRARILPRLPRRRPPLCPRRSRSRRAALPLPRARLDQPPGARGLGRAARLPGPASARTERAGDRDRHGCSAEDRRRPRSRPRRALGIAAGCRGRPGRGAVYRSSSE
jgi:hypothetical protein